MRHGRPPALGAQIHRPPSANLQATALRPNEPRSGDEGQILPPEAQIFVLVKEILSVSIAWPNDVAARRCAIRAPVHK